MKQRFKPSLTSAFNLGSGATELMWTSVRNCQNLSEFEDPSIIENAIRYGIRDGAAHSNLQALAGVSDVLNNHNIVITHKVGGNGLNLTVPRKTGVYGNLDESHSQWAKRTERAAHALIDALAYVGSAYHCTHRTFNNGRIVLHGERNPYASLGLHAA